MEGKTEDHRYCEIFFIASWQGNNPDKLISMSNALKNSVTEDWYNGEKTRLTNFIFKQPEFCLSLLPDALDFWDKLTYRCVMAFKSNTNNVS